MEEEGGEVGGEGGRSTRIIFEVMKLKTSGSLVPRQEDFKIPI